MTKVVFESATLVDAIRQAEKIAPSKGQAFDKAAGILIEVDSTAAVPVTLRTTNLDIYMMSWVDSLSVDGLTAVWRVPSRVFAPFIASLPIASGKEVILEDERNAGGYTQLNVSCGRAKAKFNLLDHENYPTWGAFSPALCTTSLDLGGRIAQVEWAASNDAPPFSGVHLDGERVIATDRYRLACMPLTVALTDPITVPAGVLGQVLKQTGECAIAVDNGQLLIMPDEYTQYRTILFGVKYPNTKSMINKTFDRTITLRKQALLEIMKRVDGFGGSDRAPAFRIFIGKEEIGVMMANDEVGRAVDILEVPGFADHPRFELQFTPKNIIQPLEMAPSEEVTLHYNEGKVKEAVKIDDGSGYEAWSQPRLQKEKEE